MGTGQAESEGAGGTPPGLRAKLCRDWAPGEGMRVRLSSAVVGRVSSVVCEEEGRMLRCRGE